MSKKHFIALADAIREHNARCLNAFGVNSGRMSFSSEEIRALADFCQSQNSQAYVNGACGPNGGKRVEG
jgi:hypothetical protein